MANNLIRAFCLLGTFVLFVHFAMAHDTMMAAGPDEAKVFDFYQKWLRPKGDFNIGGHRKTSCCNRADCFPVAETKLDARGRYIVRPDINGAPGLGQWYTVNPSIIESQQGASECQG